VSKISVWECDVMNRIELEHYIKNNYSSEPEHLWIKYPNFEVFRHQSNQKWFAMIMDIPKSRLGLEGDDIIDVVNFKCDPIMIGSFLQENGIYPAYHMNKANWLTVALDGSASDETVKLLLDVSYELTQQKRQRKK